jgi:geranylgeranyl diphosphate synthase type II
MRYSVFSGGKRLRPVLCLTTAQACGAPLESALPAACALELIHTYSLIHDDLPAMDDDDLRRGRPTSHKVFGEAIAILAGDGLLTLAFGVLAQSASPPETVVRLVRELAEAAGAAGMVGGQAADMMSEGKIVDGRTLEYIHAHKTGALLRASVRMGAVAAGAPEATLLHLTRYAEDIGLAFQIMDDLLDASELAGAGGDIAHQKATYPALYGEEASRRMIENLTRRALDELEQSGVRPDRLAELARFMACREY